MCSISASGDLYLGSTTGAYISASQGNIEISGSGTALLEVLGNISGSITSTGSFGHIMKGGVNWDTAVSASAQAAGFGSGGGEGGVSFPYTGDISASGDFIGSSFYTNDASGSVNFYRPVNDILLQQEVWGNTFEPLSGSYGLTINDWQEKVGITPFTIESTSRIIIPYLTGWLF